MTSLILRFGRRTYGFSRTVDSSLLSVSWNCQPQMVRLPLFYIRHHSNRKNPFTNRIKTKPKKNSLMIYVNSSYFIKSHSSWEKLTGSLRYQAGHCKWYGLYSYIDIFRYNNPLSLKPTEQNQLERFTYPTYIMIAV